MNESTSRRVTFGDFDLDLATAELRRHGQVVDLAPQPSRLLVLLVEQAGSLVGREELRRRLWGDNWLEWETGLHQAVRRIRSALGDSAASPRFVETVPRRGYRFIATPLGESPVASTTARSSTVSASDGRRGSDWNRGHPSVGYFSDWKTGRRIAALGIGIVVLAMVVGRLASGAPGEVATTDSMTIDPEARRLHSEGIHLLRERQPQEAIARFERAAAAAPSWAEPWSSLAEVRLALPAEDRVPQARAALEAALARDGDSVRAWLQLAQLRLWEEWDWPGARRALDQAVDLAPESAEVWQLIASLETVVGDAEAAIGAARRAVYLDPVSTALSVDLGWTLYYAGDIDAAIAECGRSLELERGNAAARQCLVQSLLVDGRRGEANDYLASGGDASERRSSGDGGQEDLTGFFERQLAALESGPTCGSSAAAALPRLALGDSGGALDALLQGAAEGHGWEVPFARVDPIFAELRAEPVFAEIERLLGLS